VTTTPSTTARRALGALLGLAFLAAAALSAAASASAATSASGPATPKVTFGVEPASAGRPDARPNLSYGVTPGSTVRDQVAIVNFSSQPLTLAVYATDAVNTSAGGFGLLDGSQKPQDVGTWISLHGGAPGGSVTVHVPAHRGAGPGFVVLPVAMHVPVGTEPGDHVGGVVAVLSTLGTTTQGAKVRLDQRVATRLFVRVSGTARPRLTVDHVTTAYHSGGATLGDGTVTVSYIVHNLGNVSLGAHQSVAVAGPFGVNRSTTSPADVPLLLPGASVRESVSVPGVLPLVHLTAIVTLRPTHPVGSVDPGMPRQLIARASFWALPWALFVLLPLAFAGCGLLWRRRRQISWKRRHRVRTASTTTLADLLGTRARQRQKASS
jgi:hypothetical protein